MDHLLKISGAMYDETRIRIIAFLSQHGECCVCELSASLDLGQSRISRHLSILEEGGFVTMTRKGKWVYYALCEQPSTLHQAFLATINTLDIPLPPKIDACRITKGDHL